MARTATPLTDGRLDRVTSGLRRFVVVSFQRRTYLTLSYLLLAFPLGIAYFVFVVTGFGLGIGLSVVLVGIPLLAAVFLVSLALAGFERWLTATLLAVDIEPRTSPEGDDHWEQARSLERGDGRTGRSPPTQFDGSVTTVLARRTSPTIRASSTTSTARLRSATHAAVRETRETCSGR